MAGQQLNTGLRSNIISAAAAAVIYFLIAVATGESVGPAIAIALGVGVVAFLIGFAFARLVRHRRRP